MQTRKSDKFCIGIILFNPSIDEINSVVALSKTHDVYVFANSILENDSRRLIEKTSFYFYSSSKNQGISKALNILLKQSIADDFDYFLCLDQDSIVGEFSSNCLLDEIHFLELEHSNYSIVGFCLNFDSGHGEFKTFFTTSGTIFRLSYLLEIGLYNENYFVDLADYELALRSSVFKLKIINLMSNTFFDHASRQADTYHGLFSMKIKSRRYGFDRLKESIYSYIRLSNYCIRALRFDLLANIFKSFMIFSFYRIIALFPIINNNK